MNKNAAALESILFAAGDPVPVARISLIMNISEDDVIDAFNELKESYSFGGHSLNVIRVGEKLQICSSPEYSSFISKILETRKPSMLSGPALEALSIVAYYQPVTQAYINKLRGVDSSYTIGALCEKGLIEAQGRLEAPGRPVLYGTTDLFLRTMGISNLSELPPLPDMQKSDAMEKILEEIEQLSASENDSAFVSQIPGQMVIQENTSGEVI